MAAISIRTGQAAMFPNPDRASFVDRPFSPPLDVVLDIPVPPSVNETRRIDRRSLKKVNAWKVHAGKLLQASGQFKFAKNNPIGDRFELTIILCEEKCALDADNPVKAAVDFLRRIEMIRNDDKRYMRKLTIEWGFAPAGCRLILRRAA